MMYAPMLPDELKRAIVLLMLWRMGEGCNASYKTR